MKVSNWLVINKNGVKAVRKQKPALDWDEIAIKVNLEIPNELFQRPTLEATVQVTDIPNNAYKPDVILDTVDLIEQQTGAKINFTVVPVEEAERSNGVN
jgi:hypothetical protein